jgi:hypothetical protein
LDVSTTQTVDRDSSVGIATRYGLDDRGIEPIMVAARLQARVCGRSLAVVAGWNLGWDMDVCVVCCKKRQKVKFRIIKAKKQGWVKCQQENTKKTPVGARFSSPVQTLPVAHPASYIISFPG